MLFELEKRQKIFTQKIQKFKNKKLWEKNGCQVVISARNAAKWLPVTLSAVENAMRNLNWVMHLGDDDSEDDTYKIAESFIPYTTAKKFNLFKYNKAKTIGEAKNRVIKEVFKYKNEYPAIFLSDADDFFTQERSMGFTEIAKQSNDYFLLGSWIYCHPEGQHRLHTAQESLQKNKFGPWATLIHADLIPDDGRLFYEPLSVYEDLLLWLELESAGAKMTPIDSIIACYYNAWDGSTSRPLDLNKKYKEDREFEYLKSHFSPEKV